MKKLSILAAAAAIAATTAAPVVAQDTQTQDPFVSTAGLALGPLLALGGIAFVTIAIAASGGTD